MAWGVEIFHLARIWASTDARNTRSRRVLEKLGMQHEAVRPADHVGRDGAAVDEVVYGRNFTDQTARLPKVARQPRSSY
jgi:RimJ/RimL family protein N-acetyltransferase